MHVDYEKFGDLTRDVLKQANVVRQKSINSPTKQLTGSSLRNPTANKVFTSFGSPSFDANSQMGSSSILMPPMSERMSSQGAASRYHVVRRKDPLTPTVAAAAVTTGQYAAAPIPKRRPVFKPEGSV